MEEDKGVSVVITTKNEEKDIGNCLESVKRQAYPQGAIEIIVVDNGSTDRTKEIALKYTDKVYDAGPERSRQRNYGIRQASGKYVLYLDADMALSPGVISECVTKCEGAGYLASYIPEKIIGTGFWIKVRDFERSFYNATPIDCVRFLLREAFFKIGGFDEDLTGPEDWDFDRRIRGAGRVTIIDSPIYHNEGRFSFKDYINKKTYYMQWFDRYAQKWGRNDPTVKKQLGFGYRYFGVFIEKNKWRRLLYYPALTLSMYFLKFVTGLCYLGHKWRV